MATRNAGSKGSHRRDAGLQRTSMDHRGDHRRDAGSKDGLRRNTRLR